MRARIKALIEKVKKESGSVYIPYDTLNDFYHAVKKLLEEEDKK